MQFYFAARRRFSPFSKILACVLCLALIGTSFPLQVQAANVERVAFPQQGMPVSPAAVWRSAEFKSQISILSGTQDVYSTLTRLQTIAAGPWSKESAAARQVLALAASPAYLSQAAPGLQQSVGEKGLTVLQQVSQENGKYLGELSVLAGELDQSPEDRALSIGKTYENSKTRDEEASAVEGIKSPLEANSPRTQSKNAGLQPAGRKGKKEKHKSVREATQALFRLRRDVQKDARDILKKELGGDVGDSLLHKDVQRVLSRLVKAAGMPKESAQVFIGNSFIPNAFTTVVPSEAKYLQQNASIAKTFRVSNIFISLGLLRAMESEGQLAFVLAHELMHNWKGHLKDFSGGGQIFLGHFHELEADAEGLKLAARAGYSTQAAIDSLYSLNRYMDRVEKEYTLLKQDKGEVAAAIQRIRDIHPHPDIRRANMLDSMNQAMELYRPARQPALRNPVWMQRRASVQRPSNLDRFEARTMKAVGEGTVEQSLYSLETFIEKEAAKGTLNLERYAIIAKMYQKLIARSDAEANLRPVEVSTKRNQNKLFPPHRLKSDLITRQLNFALAGSRSAGIPDENQGPDRARREFLLSLIRSVETRADLEKASQGLKSAAQNIEADTRRQDDQALFQSAFVRLWRAAKRVLRAELGRMPSAEEIKAILEQGYPSDWRDRISHAAASEIFNQNLNQRLRKSADGSDWQNFAIQAAAMNKSMRYAALQRLLNAISTRSDLDAAYLAVGQNLGDAGLKIQGASDYGRVLDATVRLWRAASRVLALESGRPASAEEIKEDLFRGLPEPWGEIIDKAESLQLKDRRYGTAVQKLGRNAALEEFLKISWSLGEEERRSGALLLLGSIRDRRQLDSAFRALSREAENLGLNPKSKDTNIKLTRRLWRAVRSVLVSEWNRPVSPEEIIDELKRNLPPAWLKFYRPGFNIEILETAFGPAEFRSQKFRPSELAARLEGRQDSFHREKIFANDRIFSGLSDWSTRHYVPPQAETVNGKAVYRYERYYLQGLSSPSLEDQVDITLWFSDIEPPPSLIKLLRREGKIEAFIGAVMDSLGYEFKRRIKGAATLDERRGYLTIYSQKVLSLMEYSLYGLLEFKPIRETVQAIWKPIEDLLGAEEVNASFGDSNRSYLADNFFMRMGVALRQAVIGTDMAGSRPPVEEIRLVSDLVARVEKTLRPFPASELLKAHASNLLKNISNDRGYMEAYEAAENHVVYLAPGRFEAWLCASHGKYLKPLIWLLKIVYSGCRHLRAKYKSKRESKRALFGVPSEHVRSMVSNDFVHFLWAIGNSSIDAQTKLMVVALLDRIDLGQSFGDDRLGRNIKMRAAAAAGRWLLEDVAQTGMGADALRGVSKTLLRLNDLHPGLLQPDMETAGNNRNAFRSGAGYVKRNEPYRSLAKGEHPFRGVNTRWALATMRKLDEAQAWPEKLSDTLDLLDFFNSNGEFQDEIDRRILQSARRDPNGFRDWIKNDRERIEKYGSNDNSLVPTPFGDISLPKTQPLKIVRNPALRVRLFDLLPESRMGERPPRRSFKDWYKGTKRLWKAYLSARRYFSRAFLRSLDGEGSLEDKIFDVLEETDRIATERSEDAEERWVDKNFTKNDKDFLAAHGLDKPELQWKTKLAHEKEDILKDYKRIITAAALGTIYELYSAYASLQDPVLGLILDNYPEPTRSRDELLERLIKARLLSPGRLSFLEANKSYRQPNPVRIMEKHLLDQAVIQLKKFSEAEKVDILLHIARVRRLSSEQISAFNRRILSGDRKRMARSYIALRSMAQLENYLSLMHGKDRALLVRSLFYGDHALGKSPSEVSRLYDGLVIENRNLEPFMQRLLRAYFRIMNDDERARMLSDLAALENEQAELKGPQIVRVALKSMGVTGAKIAQALATHKGLIPDAYRRELEDFKEKAQEMEKMRGYDLTQIGMGSLARQAGIDEFAPGAPQRFRARVWKKIVDLLDAVYRVIGKETSPRTNREAFSAEELDKISREALPADNVEFSLGETARRRLVKQVQYLLREQRRKMRWIEKMGPELGAGSIKLVYKVVLEDGRFWVVKMRAPGAFYRTQREFEMLEKLIEEVEKDETIEFVGIRQLLDEVKAMVRAEMDFRTEAGKESAMRDRIKSRPWYARLIAAVPYVPKPHALYVGEDLMIEEYVPTRRFSDLPGWSLIGPNRRDMAKRAVQEGMFALVFDEWLEPDPHTGNRHALNDLPHKLMSKMVLMDLGQGEAFSVEHLRPLMHAALDLESGDAAGAAGALLEIVRVPEKKGRPGILAALDRGIKAHPDTGIIERLMDGLIEAEKEGALVLPEYAALEKAMIIYTGYSEYLPKDYLFTALERATMARLLRDRPVSVSQLIRLWIQRMIHGRAAVREEMGRLIDALRTTLPPSKES